MDGRVEQILIKSVTFIIKAVNHKISMVSSTYQLSTNEGTFLTLQFKIY